MRTTRILTTLSLAALASTVALPTMADVDTTTQGEAHGEVRSQQGAQNGDLSRSEVRDPDRQQLDPVIPAEHGGHTPSGDALKDLDRLRIDTPQDRPAVPTGRAIGGPRHR